MPVRACVINYIYPSVGVDVPGYRRYLLSPDSLSVAPSGVHPPDMSPKPSFETATGGKSGESGNSGFSLV